MILKIVGLMIFLAFNRKSTNSLQSLSLEVEMKSLIRKSFSWKSKPTNKKPNKKQPTRKLF